MAYLMNSYCMKSESKASFWLFFIPASLGGSGGAGEGELRGQGPRGTMDLAKLLSFSKHQLAYL